MTLLTYEEKWQFQEAKGGSLPNAQRNAICSKSLKLFWSEQNSEEHHREYFYITLLQKHYLFEFVEHGMLSKLKNLKVQENSRFYCV
jgi:hypothetical protein